MLDPRIKMRHLDSFIEVAKFGKFSIAADKLAVSQPAISKTIKELEDYLGVTLFIRNSKGITLTSYGDMFLRHVELGLGSIKFAVNGVKQGKSDALPQIAIGVLPTVAALLMPKAIQYFSESGLANNIHLYDGPNTLLIDQLRHSDIDLMVGRLADPSAMQDLSFIHLYSEHVCFIVRPDHPLLSQKTPPEVKDIVHYQVLIPLPKSISRPVVDKLLISHGISELPNHIETSLARFGRQYVQQSDAVWITSRGIAIDDINQGILVALPIATEDTRGPVGLTCRPGASQNVALDAMINAIRRAANELDTKFNQGKPVFPP